MKTTDYILSGVIGLMGIIHISLTPMFYETMNEDATIFMGMGLAFIFLGILNFSRIFANKKSTTVLSLIGNILAVVYLIFCVYISGKIEPQFLVTIILVLGVTLMSILQLKRSGSQLKANGK